MVRHVAQLGNSYKKANRTACWRLSPHSSTLRRFIVTLYCLVSDGGILGYSWRFCWAICSALVGRPRRRGLGGGVPSSAVTIAATENFIWRPASFTGRIKKRPARTSFRSQIGETFNNEASSSGDRVARPGKVAMMMARVIDISALLRSVLISRLVDPCFEVV